MKAPIPKPIPAVMKKDEEVKDFESDSDMDETPNKPQSNSFAIEGLV